MDAFVDSQDFSPAPNTENQVPMPDSENPADLKYDTELEESPSSTYAETYYTRRHPRHHPCLHPYHQSYSPAPVEVQRNTADLEYDLEVEDSPSPTYAENYYMRHRLPHYDPHHQHYSPAPVVVPNNTADLECDTESLEESPSPTYAEDYYMSHRDPRHDPHHDYRPSSPAPADVQSPYDSRNWGLEGSDEPHFYDKKLQEYEFELEGEREDDYAAFQPPPNNLT